MTGLGAKPVIRNSNLGKSVGRVVVSVREVKRGMRREMGCMFGMR